MDQNSLIYHAIEIDNRFNWFYIAIFQEFINFIVRYQEAIFGLITTVKIYILQINFIIQKVYIHDFFLN